MMIREYKERIRNFKVQLEGVHLVLSLVSIHLPIKDQVLPRFISSAAMCCLVYFNNKDELLLADTTQCLECDAILARISGSDNGWVKNLIYFGYSITIFYIR